MDEYSTPVNDGQVSDESSQLVETTETVNADSAEVTTGETEQTAEGSQQDIAESSEKPQETSTQSKEENAQFAKVRKEAEARVRAEVERVQIAKDAEFAQLAVESGWVDGYGNPIKTETEYWKAVKSQREIDALVNSGKDPEAARAIIERDALQSKIAEIETQKQTEAKKNAENNEFFEYFKEANGRDFSASDVIPPEVFTIAAQNGLPLRFAYSDYLAKAAIAEKKNLVLGKQTAEVNNKNADTSTGSISGTGSAEPEFYSRDQVSAMTPSEVHKHFDKIESSMRKWA